MRPLPAGRVAAREPRFQRRVGLRRRQARLAGGGVAVRGNERGAPDRPGRGPRGRADLPSRRADRGRPSARVGRRLGCLRGVSTLTGFALAVEIGDWDRFTGNTIGSFVGLVPSEFSSGASRAQGSITKTGNGHVRRLLVEASWHHRPRYRIGKTMRDRWDLAPAAARVRGDEGNRRLHQRWVRFIERQKRPTVANVAIARELAGWCWSLAVLEE